MQIYLVLSPRPAWFSSGEDRTRPFRLMGQAPLCALIVFGSGTAKRVQSTYDTQIGYSRLWSKSQGRGLFVRALVACVQREKREASSSDLKKSANFSYRSDDDGRDSQEDYDDGTSYQRPERGRLLICQSDSQGAPVNFVTTSS
jgi:hypothetical protein